MGQTVQDVMTTDPGTVEASAPIIEAAQIMLREDVGSVPILEDGRLAGMLTDRDIVLRVVAEGRDARTITCAEIASRQLATIDPQQPLEEALRLMGEHQVRRLPVVEEDGKLVGVLAQADVARTDPAETGALVKEISS
jgi:CBS domain-containing protein